MADKLPLNRGCIAAIEGLNVTQAVLHTCHEIVIRHLWGNAKCVFFGHCNICNIAAIPRASGIGIEYKLLVPVIIENIIAQLCMQVFVVRARSIGVQESKTII